MEGENPRVTRVELKGAQLLFNSDGLNDKGTVEGSGEKLHSKKRADAQG